MTTDGDLFGLTQEQRRLLILSIGTHKAARPLSPIEVAGLIESAVGKGASPSELARLVLLENATMLGRFRKLLRLHPDVQYLVNWGNRGSLSFAIASEIARLDAADHVELSEAVLSHDLNKEEVRQVVQIRLRSARPISDCIADVLRQRTRVRTLHVLIGAVLDMQVKERLSTMVQAERDQWLRQALSCGAPSLPDWSGRLGTQRFSLVGDRELAEYLQGLPSGFEECVNRWLKTYWPT